MPATITLTDDLAENECRQFNLPDKTFGGFVVRHRGQVYAYHNVCPHLGIALNWLPDQFMDADHCFIQCVNHHALFTVDDGHCITGPCAGDNLTPLTVERQEGMLLIHVG
ncbi:Rieske 2Fe-2S domain-containing protein [Marinobacter sp. NFXS9]|uniref:Rieske (2Fe-2S) protein n=1 Tax=Marinobacter sp. NFXS9 TaxID=2818433 RepID=UPI0032DF16E1